MGIAPLAHASYTAYIFQSGSDVVATGSGSLDFSNLVFNVSGSCTPGVSAATIGLSLGTNNGPCTEYVGTITGPASWGAGSLTFTSSGSGPNVVITSSSIAVPLAYVSGAALGTSTATFLSNTLAGLGLTIGTYTYSWGTTNPDTFTVNINTSSPESSSAPLTLAGLGVISLLMWKRRRNALGGRGLTER